MKKASITISGEKINFDITVDITGISLKEAMSSITKIIEKYTEYDLISIYFYTEE